MTGDTSISGGDSGAPEAPDDELPVARPTLSADEGVLGEMPEVERPTGRSTAIFAIWTGLSRVAGLAREILAAAMFGTQGDINAFVIAFNVPNIVRSLVADSAISAALIPIYTDLIEQGRKKDAQRLIGAVVGLVVMVLGAVTLLAIALAPVFMPWFALGLSPALKAETVTLSQIMFPIILLLALTGIVAAVLQANGEFGVTGFVPVLWNVVIIVCLGISEVVLPADERVTGYAVGIVLGTLAQLLWLLPYMRGKGPFPFSLGRGVPEVRRVFWMMLPVSLGLGLININASVDNVFAGLVSTDAVSSIDKAFRLYVLPQGVFSVAISTVLFPAISRMASRNDLAGVRQMVASGLRQIFFMLVPASIFLMVLAEPATRLVYQRGAFDAASTSLTSQALFAFTLGLVFNGASLLVIRTFFSLQEPWIATKVALLGLALNAVGDLAFYQPFGAPGIPLSTSLVSVVTFGVLMVLLQRRIGGLARRDITRGFLQCVFAGIIMGIFTWATFKIVSGLVGTSLAGQLISMSFAVVAAGLAYLAGAHAVRLHELNQLTRLVRALR
jgi:putative peptidoglycan lipid II flippase